MGRIFETRKHVMFARWNRMAKQFTRIGKDITIAVKAAGPDPDNNPALRRVIQNARSVNMPKDKVEAAIKRASGKDVANYEEVIYEGYAPHGIAVLVQTAADNPTRTVGNVRNVFNKNGGNFAATGSVSFMFRRMGVFRLDPAGIDQDDLELYLIDHGLEEMGESSGENQGQAQRADETHANLPGKSDHSSQPAALARGLPPVASGCDARQYGDVVVYASPDQDHRCPRQSAPAGG